MAKEQNYSKRRSEEQFSAKFLDVKLFPAPRKRPLGGRPAGTILCQPTVAVTGFASRSVPASNGPSRWQRNKIASTIGRRNNILQNELKQYCSQCLGNGYLARDQQEQIYANRRENRLLMLARAAMALHGG
ncbi:hypothetical protein [Cupriavidus sp. UME77]|uniref:hypothetical protein n=1 Tax=Cupriavidus sp. UME77 TaxID=1862321 RepID=UPI0015FFEAD3|nr:hypothetical protein [Cupriavidus sp. UME77]